MSKDIVFVDTSIYIAENYFAPNNRILALRNLVESGIISVVSTKITNIEVLRHFKDGVTAAWNDVTNKHRSLKCFDIARPFFNESTKEYLPEMCETIFNEFQQKAHVYSIGFEYCSDVETIFEKYFKGEKPSSRRQRKISARITQEWMMRHRQENFIWIHWQFRQSIAVGVLLNY